MRRPPGCLALYVRWPSEQGVDRAKLTGTVQNDIIKEYLSRGTYIFPPDPSLAADHRHHQPSPIGKCPNGTRPTSAPITCRKPGATPVQELAFALANAAGRARFGQGRAKCPRKISRTVVGRISFFVNAGLRFITELSKMRAFVDLWDEITPRHATDVEDPKLRRFRYGVQVNSLGLTEQQPENNVYRILAVDAGRDAFEERACACRSAAGLERGARPAAPLGPAMVASAAANRGLRDRSSWNTSDHLRRLTTWSTAKVETLKEEAPRGTRQARSTSWAGAVAAVAIDYMKESLWSPRNGRARLQAIERRRPGSWSASMQYTARPNRHRWILAVPKADSSPSPNPALEIEQTASPSRPGGGNARSTEAARASPGRP